VCTTQKEEVGVAIPKKAREEQ
jgi:hypothetical protein